jgi:PPM family protein phosphatase
MSGASSDDTLKDSPEQIDPVAKQFGRSPRPVAVQFGSVTHPGKSRANNEDRFMVVERRRTREILRGNLPPEFLPRTDDSAFVMAVADGMGGSAFGEIASMLALRSSWDLSPKAIKWMWIVNDREVEDLRERVGVVFHHMDKVIRDHAQKNPASKGMASTATAAYTTGTDAFIMHVGDSRAYLFHAGKLSQLTHDHTVAQHQIDLGLPVESKSWRHQLTNVLGGDERQLYVEFHHIHLDDGDKLLLCTDGLTQYVRNEEIATFLTPRADPQATAQALLNLALERGGEDDVTVILAQYALVHGQSEPNPAASSTS